ncbi:hypothetical protein EV714DRAFT_240093 [Schizophyllum commune]
MASTARAQQRDLRALTSLLDELEELSMSPTSDFGTQARKKYLSDRIEDLVQNGCPFEALEAVSPASSYSGGPVISLDEEPLQSAVQALDQYQNLCSLIEREMKHKPRVVGFAERMTAPACRWMNFIHPMNGNVTRAETTRDYQHTTFQIVSATGGMISLPRNDQTLIRFLDTAGFVTMNIDIWANFFRYNKFSPAPLAASAVSNLLCLYDVPMGSDFARAEARKRLSREMVHAFGKHPRRLCKVIARYAEVLIGSPPPEVDAQCMLFTAANTLLGVKELRPYTCPRRVVSKLVHVIDRRSRGLAHECRAAVTAVRYLERLWLITSDNRTLEWSINDGILYPILRIMIAYPPPHEYHEILRPVLQTLYRSFIHYRVLLSFYRTRSREGQRFAWRTRHPDTPRFARRRNNRFEGSDIDLKKYKTPKRSACLCLSHWTRHHGVYKGIRVPSHWSKDEGRSKGGGWARKRKGGPSPRFRSPTLLRPASEDDELESPTNHPSAFHQVLTAFTVLLHRYTGDTNLVIGSSSASARKPLVLCLSAKPANPFWAILRRIQQVENEAERDAVPFDSIMQALNKNEALQGPIFRVRFFDGTDETKEHFLSATSATSDLTVFITRGSASSHASLAPRISLRIVYNSLLFTHARIAHIVEQLSVLLRKASTNPVLPVGSIPLLTPSQREKLPNPTADLDWCGWKGAITDVFTRNAKQWPDRPCVIQSEKITFSYGAICHASNVLAHHLLSAGVQREEVVMVYTHRSVDFVVAVMAVLKVGATFSVIDPAYPASRQIIYLRVAQPRPLVVLKGASTIGPSGVKGCHFSLTHFFPWMSEHFSLDETSQFTMLSGIAHDPIQRDMFTPLFLGAQLHVPTGDDIGVPGRLAEWMADSQVTVTHLTHAMGQLLCAQATRQIPHLQNAFFAGNVLTKRDCLSLQALAANVRIINMYGTTETQRAVSYFAIPPVAQDPTFLATQKDIMPVGSGMIDVQLLVVNRHNKNMPCAIREVGEIYVRSGGLAEGYLDADA